MRSFGQLWPTLKRLLAYGSPWRKQLAIAVVMLWVAAAAEVSGPLLISYFIDNMVAKNNLPLAMVAGLVTAYIGLQLLAAGLHYAQSLLFNQAAVGVVQQLRTDVMDAALRQPLSAFDTQPVGQLISRVTNDTEVIRDLYVTVMMLSEQIGTAAHQVLEKTPPELAGDIYRNGVMLTGGGAQLHGLTEYLSQELKVEVTVSPDPVNCVALGTAQSLSIGDKLETGFTDATPRIGRR